MKLKFYIESEDHAARCAESMRLRSPITIEGYDPLTGRNKSYKGVVLDVETVAAEVAGERWRIAIETELRTIEYKSGNHAACVR